MRRLLLDLFSQYIRGFQKPSAEHVLMILETILEIDGELCVVLHIIGAERTSLPFFLANLSSIIKSFIKFVVPYNLTKMIPFSRRNP